jgi:hypothetical protein
MVYIFDVVNNTATFDSNDDGSMKLIGSGDLTQGQVNNAITSYSKSGGKSVSLPSTVLIAGTFTSLGTNAFRGTGFTLINFSENSKMTTISGTLTFYGCSLMTSLILPPKLTVIPEEMCNSCLKLETILIPSTVTSIKAYGFYNCRKLHTVTFGPDSKLTYMGDAVFYSKAMAKIEFPPSFTSFSDGTDGMFGPNSPGDRYELCE